MWDTKEELGILDMSLILIPLRTNESTDDDTRNAKHFPSKNYCDNANVNFLLPNAHSRAQAQHLF